MDEEILKLTKEFKKIEDQLLRSALKDLFGLGLYLHATGKAVPGLKTCQTSLRAIGFNKKYPKETHTIMSKIKGNEKYFLNKLRVHSEINSLF